MIDFFQNKIVPVMMKFVNTKTMKSISNGMVRVIPLTLVGSLFLIVWNFPIPAIKNVIEMTGYSGYLLKMFFASTGIIALVASISIAYEYAQLEDVDPLGCAITSFAAFIMICPDFVMNNDAVVGGVFNMTWAGSQGMIGAIFISIMVAKLYVLFIKKDVRIKLPSQVPMGIQNSFNALVPTLIISILVTILYAIFDKAGTTMMDLIYTLLQTPLQGLVNSPFALVVSVLISTVFWWLGIHGGTINIAIFGSLLAANNLHNAEITAAGLVCSAETGAFIFEDSFNFNFIIMCGTGITVGMVIYMLFLAKSETFKAVGKLSIVPTMFCVNEPVLFGTPIVLNPMLLVPFVVTPLVSSLLAYGLIYFGVIPYPTGIYAPSLTPPIISGFIAGGWKWAALQAVIIVLSFLIYYPFIKKADEIQYEKEQQSVNIEKK